MIVCIAEKPSVGRDIARILGATHSHNGFMEGNGYCVTWVFGHLCELKDPGDYLPAWKPWSLAALPMIPPRFGIRLKADKGAQRQFEVIKQLIAKAERIINCGDAGQEGELIQRWVMQMAGAKCPVMRLWISSLTEEAIQEGFKNLRDQSEYQSLYYAGMTRAIGDWVLGMNATRLYTLKYGTRERGAQPLSIGRVQTPTLALIVQRQHEIDAFKSEPYWVLCTTYRDTVFTATQGKFTDEQVGRNFLQQVTGSDFTVTDVTTKQGKEAPPRLFDLTSLQVACNKKFGLSADETLQTIQGLYEKKLTTYPRVDTTYLSEDIYAKCKTILANLPASYAPLVESLRGKALRKRKKVFDNSKITDHHAIIPTGVQPSYLTQIEQHVFDLITRHFIATFYDDCIFSTTTVLGEAAQISFKVTGKQILDAAWRVVFAKIPETKLDGVPSKEASDEEECVLPLFSKGECGPHSPDLLEKLTQPPKPYTEGTLLRAMETAGKLVDDEALREALKENGIGRPSTRASIIETLLRRKYIKKVRKNLIPTTTGNELISLIHEDLLKSAELTGIWERKLRGIERQEYDAQTFMNELKLMVTDLVHQVLCDNTNRKVSASSSSATLVHDITQKAAAKKRKANNKNTSKTPSKTKPDLTPVKVGDLCPLCAIGHIIQGKTALGCSRWKEGCTFRQDA